MFSPTTALAICFTASVVSSSFTPLTRRTASAGNAPAAATTVKVTPSTTADWSNGTREAGAGPLDSTGCKSKSSRLKSRRRSSISSTGGSIVSMSRVSSIAKSSIAASSITTSNASSESAKLCRGRASSIAISNASTLFIVCFTTIPPSVWS